MGTGTDDAAFGVKVALGHGAQGQRRLRRYGPRLSPVGGRVGAESDLREPLPSNPAGVVECDLARVAKAFTALLLADAILDQPALGATAKANAEAGRLVVPYNMIRLVGRQRRHGGFGELHCILISG